jgi:hypothetical protein
MWQVATNALGYLHSCINYQGKKFFRTWCIFTKLSYKCSYKKIKIVRYKFNLFLFDFLRKMAGVIISKNVLSKIKFLIKLC